MTKDKQQKPIQHIRNCSNCQTGCTKPASCCVISTKYSCDKHSFTQVKPLVYIASALRGDIVNNLIKAGDYTKRALHSNVLPITPHLNWATILDDAIIDERILGMSAGANMLLKCAAVWVFGIISEGVQSEIDLALEHNIPVYLIDDQRRLSMEWRNSTIHKYINDGYPCDSTSDIDPEAQLLFLLSGQEQKIDQIETIN